MVQLLVVVTANMFSIEALLSLFPLSSGALSLLSCIHQDSSNAVIVVKSAGFSAIVRCANNLLNSLMIKAYNAYR